ncbi:unnamed protein product [Adineta ricciae]|uniref:Uncharacterized protein n=1 Tax=Adineta ricciae TaxID=249248 RepID=A0A814XXN9_ADIRI|nr:unnamed protein product [Adineta ricciae]CAF1608475.1 unnamed protein product [Adineta ricciae]
MRGKQITLSYLIFLISSVSSFQVNLAFTDLRTNGNSDLTTYHHCLYFHNHTINQTIPFCITEKPTMIELPTNDDHDHQRLKFKDLQRQNITSEQLYLWSAPTDVAEDYQFYLDQYSTSAARVMDSNYFYNCTWPKFGSECEYSIDGSEFGYSSLHQLIRDFYAVPYLPSTFTCYEHLPCNRGTPPVCLDWTEICDGRVNCIDGEEDEEHCWQLEINECEEKEYRCANGQCIDREFFRDGRIWYCLDGSDKDLRTKDIEKVKEGETPFHFQFLRDYCQVSEPTLQCEDVRCELLSDHISPSFVISSSCTKKRLELIWNIAFFKPTWISENCWGKMVCCFALGYPSPYEEECSSDCLSLTCLDVFEKTLSNRFFSMPTNPSAFGYFHILFVRDSWENSSISGRLSEYICVPKQSCNSSLTPKYLSPFGKARCYDKYTLNSKDKEIYSEPTYNRLASLFYAHSKCHIVVDRASDLCEKWKMYKCRNSSRCISRYRLKDGVFDCYLQDDESIDKGVPAVNCSSQTSEKLFLCRRTNTCIPYSFFQNGRCNCPDYVYLTSCEDEYFSAQLPSEHISFPTICDGFVELDLINIDGDFHTDETVCEHWPCNNAYTRCDGYWNCPNGADEIHCDPSPLIPCPIDHHICLSSETDQLVCLPIDRANDGHMDCLGGTDEPFFCRSADSHFSHTHSFLCIYKMCAYCLPLSSACAFDAFCCPSEGKYQDLKPWCGVWGTICPAESQRLSNSSIKEFVCQHSTVKSKLKIIYFSLEKVSHSLEYLPTLHSTNVFTLPPSTRYPFDQSCHRGFPLRLWLNSTENRSTIQCLCPPSFYGPSCEYQNQRISLSLQFQSLSDSWQTVFTVIATLIDQSDERPVHSFQQFSYLPVRDCHKKFHFYLFYSTRPKNGSKTYSIHIDIFEKRTRNYRGSWFLSIPFPFLPVQRMAAHLIIPRSIGGYITCSDRQCHYGQCIEYVNTLQRTTFCRCEQGWSGAHCTIQHNCTCSKDALCLGLSVNDQPICLCPLGRFGRRCLLTTSVCQAQKMNLCENNGQCIPDDQHDHSEKRYTCICPKGSSGDRCAISDTNITISFHPDISPSQAMLIHFIRVMNEAPPVRTTTLKTISINKESVTIYWSHPFHLIFIEFPKHDYYLTAVQLNNERSAQLKHQIHPSDRCPHVSKLFNRTIAEHQLIRRIKYYHVPCQQLSRNLSCFYDEFHLCLCQSFGHQRVANCFEFDHQLKMDCAGQNGCENGADCFQDAPKCAQTSICDCKKCFYGRLCQFRTDAFSLTLDAILGYHILPGISLTDQPMAVKIGLALTIIMTVAGVVNGILCLITFQSKKLREVGCGIYLLVSSVTTLLTVTAFALKFGILVSAQTGTIQNQSFLRVQCSLMEFLVRLSLYMEQWLNACVASERAMTTISGTGFNKKKSTKIAKRMIIILLLFTVVSDIHDPFHRFLLIDNDSDNGGDERGRIWCITRYPPFLQTFDRVIQAFHTLTPFFISFISVLIIIVATTRQRGMAQNQQPYHVHLRYQLRNHRHVLVAPVVLIILTVPRLIIALVSGCLRSAQLSWLFFAGYFLAFSPPMVTFLVFVMPSKLYMQEFKDTIRKYRLRWKICLSRQF